MYIITYYTISYYASYLFTFLRQRIRSFQDVAVPSDSKVLQRRRFDSPRLAYLVSAYSATFVYCWPRWSTACLSLQEANTVSDPEFDTASY